MLRKNYIILVFFFVLAPCGSVFAAGQNDPSIQPASKHSRYSELLSRYDRFPYQSPKVATPEDLPAALQLMVKNGRTDFLDELAKTCRTLLFQQAATYDIPIDFFRDYPDNPPAQQLRELLDTTWEYLKITNGVIADLNTFLDWYPGEDWHMRFGVTGFYLRIQQFDRDVRFLFAVYWYYQARIQQLQSTNDKSSLTQAPLMQHVKQSFAMLKTYLADENQKPDTLLVVKLWTIRLARALAFYEPAYYGTTRQQLDLILQAPLDTERQYEFRLESLRCALAAPVLRVSELETFILQIHQFRGWLELNRYSVLDSKTKYLQLAFLESVVQQKRRSLTTSLRRLREQAYVSDRTYLQPLLALAERETEFTSLIQQMIAARLAASIQALVTYREKNWGTYLHNGTDVELLSLARYYRNQTPPDFVKAHQVYEIFIKTRSPVHDRMPEVLYDAALCCYQLSQPKENSAKKAENLVSLVRAIYYWDRLARKFPQWTGKTDPQTVNAYQAIRQSASCAYRLSKETPEKYSELARETLAILVGTISSSGSKPAGPFAETPAARQNRYYFALLLFQQNEYEQAADWFAAVPANDPRHQAARYYAIRCRYQQFRPDPQNPNAQRELYSSWIAELEKLLQEKTSDAIDNQVVTLLIQLYQDLDQTDNALQAIARALQNHANQPQWITAALKILQGQRQTYFRLHAEANFLELSTKLTKTLPASRVVYDILTSKSWTNSASWKEQKDTVIRIHLEQLGLAVMTILDIQETHTLGPLRPLIDQAEKIISHVKANQTFTNQVWFVRCRAQLAFGQGDDELSRQLWHQIRSVTTEKKDELSKYYWWESRYFSLRCLIRMHRTDEAEHVIQVLLRSHPDETSPWLIRLQHLQNQLKNEN
jgi:hypothetical protein